MNRCPPREHLARLLVGGLTDDEGRALDAHLPACPSCQSTLAELSDGDNVPRWRQWARTASPPTEHLGRVRRAPPVSIGPPPVSTPFPGPPRSADLLPSRAPVGYEILGMLGRGGAGVVYKARQLSLGRLVALKMLRVGAQARPDELARFFQEAEAVARLRHPHIVQIHEIGTHDGLPFLALEYIDGGSLADRLGRRPQPSRSAAEMAGQLARAVQHAHDAGVVHRDLKPANVLLSRRASGLLTLAREKQAGRLLYEFEPKVADFGLARRLDGDGSLTNTGDVLGTPCYMAPEQAQGRGREAGPPADVYALGAVLYEMLTGRPPFHSAAPLETLLQVVHHEPAPPRQLQPGVPRDLETICLKCLQKDPARRYPTAGELADDLERFLAGHPVQARPTGPVAKAAKWARRSPSTAALALIGLMLATIGFPLVSLLWLDSARAHRAAEQEKKDADELRLAAESREARLTAARALDLCDRGEVSAGLALLADALAMAERLPDQEALSRALRVNLAEWPGQLRRAGSLHEHPVGRVRNLVFSPGGDTLALCGPQGIQLWDPEGTRLRKRLLAPGPLWLPEPPCGGSVGYTPDGELLVAGYDEGKVRLWDTRTGVLRGSVQTDDGGRLNALAVHPAGTTFAVATDRGVQFWSLPTPKLLGQVSHPKRVMCLAYSPDGKHLAVGDYRGQVWLWPAASTCVASGKESGPPLRHALTITGLAFDPRPERRTVATASRDGTVRLWDVATGESRGRPLYHADEAAAVAWSPDGRWLLTGGRDRTAQLWDAETLTPVDAPWRLDGDVLALRFAPSSRSCVLSTGDGRVHFWHLPRGREPERSLPHDLPVEQVGFWPDGQSMATAGWRGVRLWAEDGKQIGAFETGERLRHAAWARRAPALISSHWRQDVERWRLEGEPVRLAPALSSGKGRPVAQVALSPDGSTAYGVIDNSTGGVHRWDVNSGRPLPGHGGVGGAISRLALSPDGKTLAAIARTDGMPGVWLWPADDPSDRGRGLTTDEPPRCLAFSADGGLLAVGCRSGRVRLWDARRNEEVRWGDGRDHHRGEVLAVAISPDGKTLLTGGTDGRGRFWDAATGLPLGPPLPHSGPVLAVAYREDGRAVLTGCQDGRAFRWRPPEERK